jgi:hypothetical protein
MADPETLPAYDGEATDEETAEEPAQRRAVPPRCQLCLRLKLPWAASLILVLPCQSRPASLDLSAPKLWWYPSIAAASARRDLRLWRPLPWGHPSARQSRQRVLHVLRACLASARGQCTCARAP